MATQPSAESFEAVALPHLAAAYNLARWLMRNNEDAEDVVQEAMVRALTYFDGFRGTNIRAWLLQIVRNVAFASMRLNRGIKFVPIGGPGEDSNADAARSPDLRDPHEDPESALIHAREKRQLDALLAQLPVELREVIILRELEELSYKEIAQITDAPIGTVMSRLFRARRLLEGAAVESEERSA